MPRYYQSRLTKLVCTSFLSYLIVTKCQRFYNRRFTLSLYFHYIPFVRRTSDAEFTLSFFFFLSSWFNSIFGELYEKNKYNSITGRIHRVEIARWKSTKEVTLIKDSRYYPRLSEELERRERREEILGEEKTHGGHVIHGWCRNGTSVSSRRPHSTEPFYFIGLKGVKYRWQRPSYLHSCRFLPSFFPALVWFHRVGKISEGEDPAHCGRVTDFWQILSDLASSDGATISLHSHGW